MLTTSSYAGKWIEAVIFKPPIKPAIESTDFFISADCLQYWKVPWFFPIFVIVLRSLASWSEVKPIVWVSEYSVSFLMNWLKRFNSDCKGFGLLQVSWPSVKKMTETFLDFYSLIAVLINLKASTKLVVLSALMPLTKFLISSSVFAWRKWTWALLL